MPLARELWATAEKERSEPWSWRTGDQLAHGPSRAKVKAKIHPATLAASKMTGMYLEQNCLKINKYALPFERCPSSLGQFWNCGFPC